MRKSVLKVDQRPDKHSFRFMQKAVEGFVLSSQDIFDIVKVSKRTISMCGSFPSETRFSINIFNKVSESS